MKTRVISGVSFGLLGIAIVVLTFSPLPDIMVYAISLMSVYELMKTFGVVNKLMYVFGIGFSALEITYMAYAQQLGISINPVVALIVYFVAMLMLTLIDFGRTTFNHVALTAFSSMVLPGALGCFLKMRNMVGEYGDVLTRGHMRFLIWFCLAGAVFSDTFALFAGVKFGKHKLSPRISPKKTVEGLIGGVLGSALINIIALLICNYVCYRPFPIPVWLMVIVSLAVPLVGTLGDLTASAIKRNYGIKDFGNLIPGHGGIMDRMDSISLVTPFVYAVLYIYLELTV